MNREIISMCIIFLLLFIPSVAAVDHLYDENPGSILINSRDWRDVYSGLLFAELIGREPLFLVSQEDALLKTELIPKTDGGVMILETPGRYYAGLEGLVGSKGHDATTVSAPTLNLELAENLEVDGFVVVGDAYGYNAISVTPYAVLNERFVLFANRDNIDDVVDLLDENGGSVMIYGVVDNEVRDELAKFNPDVIDEGSRLENNHEIVRRFIVETEMDQAWIVSGKELVKPIFSPTSPVMFIGNTNVPPQVDTFLAENNIKALVLIGNELAPMVSQFKSRYENAYETDLIVTVLIGRSPRTLGMEGDRLEAIDTFRVPIPELDIEVSDVVYNQITQTLEVTYKNTLPAPLYFRSTITVGVETEGDEESVFLSGGRSRTLSYPMNIGDPETAGKISIIYGEDRETLDSLYSIDLDSINFIDIVDSSELAIHSVVYDRLNHAIYIMIENTGEVSLFADLELDISIDGQQQTLFGPEVFHIMEGESREVLIRQRLTGLDLQDNEEVTARAYYSQREIALSKIVEETLPLGRMIPATAYAFGAVGLILLILIIWFFFRKKRQR